MNVEKICNILSQHDNCLSRMEAEIYVQSIIIFINNACSP